MKKNVLLLMLLASISFLKAQDSKKNNPQTLLIELGNKACDCIDSVDTYNKSVDDVTKEISECIDKNVDAFQLGSKLMSIDLLKDNQANEKGKRKINITINTNKNTSEYKKYYYEMERYLMENCPSLKRKIAGNEKQNNKSISKNEEAKKLYDRGLDEAANNNYEKAIYYYEAALKLDPEFAFAWDNLGLTYRKMNNYDKAIESYQKSLEIDPDGRMPLQNIAVAYQYKKDFQAAINTYEKLAKLDPTDPETFYGIGHIYVSNLKELEKGLDNLCKAYNIYVMQKSPYRTDAEKLIGAVYNEMKKQGKENTFKDILKANKIKFE